MLGELGRNMLYLGEGGGGGAVHIILRGEVLETSV